MSTLVEILNKDGLRPQVIDDCMVALEGEVAKKKGPIGFAIRKGYGVVSKLDNGRIIRGAVDSLLDRFVAALDPYYQSYLGMDEASRPSFTTYLSQNSAEVAEALLSVTDRQRDKSNNRILVKSYNGLRPTGLKHVKEGVPAVAGIIEKYAFVQPVQAAS